MARDARGACAACGAPGSAARKLKLCAQCGSAAYCGAECQRAAWPEHKAWCKFAKDK